jgi:CRISPR-associated endonuclease Cas2
MHWLIAYDIRLNRRRSQVAKRLERAGLRVQKSVFIAELSRDDLQQLMDQLAAIIDRETDTVAAWALQQKWQNEQVEAGLPKQPVFQDSVVW